MYDLQGKRIWVAGHRGMVGAASVAGNFVGFGACNAWRWAYNAHLVAIGTKVALSEINVHAGFTSNLPVINRFSIGKRKVSNFIIFVDPVTGVTVYRVWIGNCSRKGLQIVRHSFKESLARMARGT